MSVFGEFAEYYDLIYREIRDCERECDALEKIFARFSGAKPRRVLDVGCGTGSHAVILSGRGYDVVGLDVSKAMIEKAKQKAEKRRVHAEFLVQDMREIKLDGKFDCAVCMFGAFSYLIAYGDVAALFSGLKKCLRKGGLFIFSFWNVGGVRPSPYRTWIRASDGDLCVYRVSETNFDPSTNVIDLDMNFIAIRGSRLVETFGERHKLRCCTVAELSQYLRDGGFSLLSAFDWDSAEKEELKEHRKETFSVLAVARKV